VGPFCTDAATKAEKEFANAEASKGALVLRRPSRGLTELLRHLAESRSNGRYLVRSADWLKTMLTATKGLGRGDEVALRFRLDGAEDFGGGTSPGATGGPADWAGFGRLARVVLVRSLRPSSFLFPLHEAAK